MRARLHIPFNRASTEDRLGAIVAIRGEETIVAFRVRI